MSPRNRTAQEIITEALYHFETAQSYATRRINEGYARVVAPEPTG